jgi:hypothetical protein
MSTPGELATYQYNKGADGCFLVPKKQDKWFFGRLQHNISFLRSDDIGTCVLSDGTVQTFFTKHIGEAVKRLRNKIPFHLSEYKKDYEFGGKESLDFYESTIDPEKLKLLIEASIALFRTTYPPKIVKEVGHAKPIPPKSIYPAPRAQLTRIASPSGPGADFPQLRGETMCGWHQGLLKKFVPSESKPNGIGWSIQRMDYLYISN